MLQAIRAATMRRVRALLSLPPFGRDLVARIWDYPRTPTSYRGVFATRREALAASTPALPSHYDASNEAKEFEEELAAAGRRFDPSDYPLVLWLSSVLEEGSHVLDLGGRFGHPFYAYQGLIPYPPGLRWTVADLPAAVALGRRIAEAKGEERLRFVARAEEADPADVFLTSGALQYMEASLADVLAGLPWRPTHVLVNRVPMYDGEPFWTLQNLGVCEVPYRICNRDQVIASLRELRYELVDAWWKEREVRIPFAWRRKVDGFAGLYLAEPETAEAERTVTPRRPRRRPALVGRAPARLRSARR